MLVVDVWRTDVVFEPNPKLLELHGLNSPEAILKVDVDGKVMVPLMSKPCRFRGRCPTRKSGSCGPWRD